MKHYYLFTVLLILAGYCCEAQPANPSPCGTGGGTTFTISNSTVIFNFATLSSFTTTNSNNTVTLSIKSNSGAYVLYVAGSISYLGSLPNTPIPLSSFTVGASNFGSATSSVTLGSSYLPIANRPKTTGSGETQTITITVNPTLPGGVGSGTINQFTQGPGAHTLTLYFCLCN